MKVNLYVKLLGFDGCPVKKTKVVTTDGVPEAKEIDGEFVLLSDVIANAVSSTYRDDDKISPDEKLNRFALALETKKAKGPIEISVEDAGLIKKMAVKGCSVLAYGRICELLESAETKAKDE